MVSFIPLNQVEYPKNALLDFTPLNNAISEYGRVTRDNEQKTYDRQRQAVADQRSAANFEQQQKQWKREDVEYLGKQALAISQRFPKGSPQRAQAWNAWVQKHGGTNLTPEEMHPDTGPELAAASAGQWTDPAETEAKKLALEKTRADLDYSRAQTQELQQKDAVGQAILKQLFGSDAGAGQSMPPAQSNPSPSYQPQSYAPAGPNTPPPINALMPQVPPNAGPQGMNALMPTAPAAPTYAAPMIQRVAEQSAPNAVPSAPSAPPRQAEPMINTPYGMKSRSEALKIGGAMLLDKRFEAAGKAILEQAQGQSAMPGKEGQNKIDAKQFDAVNHMARLNEIAAQVKPEYQQIGTRFMNFWNAGLDKIGKLNPADGKQLREYTMYRRSAVDNMSRLLNELSGAAVSPQEYERIRQTQPDAGTGILDGDSPTEFQAKLDGARGAQLRAIARYNYLRSQGYEGKPWEAMPLDGIDKIIEQRGAAIEQQLRQQYPKADPTAIDQELKAQLSREFGVAI